MTRPLRRSSLDVASSPCEAWAAQAVAAAALHLEQLLWQELRLEQMQWRELRRLELHPLQQLWELRLAPIFGRPSVAM